MKPARNIQGRCIAGYRDEIVAIGDSLQEVYRIVRHKGLPEDSCAFQSSILPPLPGETPK